MSRAAEKTLPFGGGTRLFRLPIGRLRALQEVTDAGPLELLTRLQSGTWKLDDVREPIRQGLIGGDMAVYDVDTLLAREFDDLPKLQFVPLATALMMMVLTGIEDEPMGEAKRKRGSRRLREEK